MTMNVVGPNETYMIGRDGEVKRLDESATEEYVKLFLPNYIFSTNEEGFIKEVMRLTYDDGLVPKKSRLDDHEILEFVDKYKIASSINIKETAEKVDEALGNAELSLVEYDKNITQMKNLRSKLEKKRSYMVKKGRPVNEIEEMDRSIGLLDGLIKTHSRVREVLKDAMETHRRLIK
jgi:hypothetical protein